VTTCLDGVGIDQANIVNADVDDNGQVDAVDAPFIAQCDSGVANVLCPLDVVN